MSFAGLKERLDFRRLSLQTRAVVFGAIVYSILLSVGMEFFTLYGAQAALSVIFILLVRKSRLLSIVFCAFAIAPICYTIVGLSYGIVSVRYVAAALETNPSEASEFLSLLPPQNCLFAIACVSLLIFTLFFNIGGSVAIAIARDRVVDFAPPPPPNNQITSKYKKIGFWLIIILLFFGTQEFRFYKLSFKRYNQYKEALSQYARLIGKPDFALYKRIDSSDKEVRIVVIGESVRKDYLSVYGYPHKTTPFLNEANGTFIDGLIAPAYVTYSSLPVMFSANKSGAIDPGNNIIALANAAQLETFWLSNQSYYGEYDNAVTIFAKQSAHDSFYKRARQDDFNLLQNLETALQTKSDKNKMIFLHMIGSHSDVCERVVDYPNNFTLNYGKEHNCYLASVEKLDTFIKKIVDRLNAGKLSWSLLYFSDHGQGHSSENGDLVLRHLSVYKQAYEVPLFTIDSNSDSHIVIKRNISGANFIDLFAAWIGYETNVTDNRYTFIDFPEAANITVNDNTPFESLKDDPALY
jgi:glucan phosphoethanolaminetransferase (alkaline phosphatase superfamily)